MNRLIRKKSIALDIDGTITKGAASLEKDIESYLISLMNDGWQLFFVTGRTFAFAAPLFSNFNKRFYLAVQNGAELFEMPNQKSLKSHYIKVYNLSKWLHFFKEERVGLIIESGKKYGDVTYYCPNDFSNEEKAYLKFRQSLSKDKWIPLSSMIEFPLPEFAVGKYFSDESRAINLAKKLGNTIVIKDPFRPGFYIGHVNQTEASKANILKSFDPPIISAGDDFNDFEMLKLAKIKIVMPHAPEEIKKIADIIADQGLLKALDQAKFRFLESTDL